jgi:hypothetical protein
MNKALTIAAVASLAVLAACGEKKAADATAEAAADTAAAADATVDAAAATVDAAAATTAAAATDAAATAAGGTAWVHKMTDLVEGGNNYIDGTGKGISSMLVLRLHRNAGAGSDTLAADVALLELDLHYEIDTVGSRTASTK